MKWALTKVKVRLPEGVAEETGFMKRLDGKRHFVAEVYADEDGKPWGFAKLTWHWMDIWTVFRYSRDLLNTKVIEYPKDFVGEPFTVELEDEMDNSSV